MESLKGFHIFFQENPLQLSTNLSLGHILIIAMLYMINQTESFCTKIDRIQYNAALAITGAIRGTSQFKLFNPQGSEDGLDDSVLS